MEKNKLTAIDLFTGAGGMSIGLQKAGFKVIAGVESSKAACETLLHNRPNYFPDMDIIQTDITTLSGERLLERVGLKTGELDLLAGGPPCQGFSTANLQRSADDPRSKLMWQFIRIMNEIQPRYFIIENVRGILNFKDFFVHLLSSLENCGYKVRFNLLDAVNYGVPQFRKRVFINGTRNDLNILPVFPPPINFDIKTMKARMKKSGNYIAPWLVSKECFATNGFTKEEINDIWWNTKLEILMNKKTAQYLIEVAIGKILAKAIKEELCRPILSKIEKLKNDGK